MNNRLERQLAKYLAKGIELPVTLNELFREISDTYDSYENHQGEIAPARQEKDQLEAHLQASQRVARIGSWESELLSLDDLSSNPLHWSDETFRIFGFEPGAVAVTNRLFFSRIHRDDRHKIDEADRHAIASGKATDLGYRIVLPDGTVKHIHERKELVFDKATGKPIRVFGTIQDITERVEAEEALRQSEHKFRSLIRNSSDAITLSNKDLEMVFASESLRRITGFRPEETVGTTIFTFCHPDDKEIVRQFLARLMKNPGKPLRIEYRTMRKDGTYMWCERVSTNLIDDPAMQGIVSNLRDITERKEYEQALKLTNEELEKSNSELDRFVYSVSHDLRAPLASIEGMLCLAEAETDLQSLQEYFPLMKESVRKLDGFILDILDYSTNSRTEIIQEEIRFSDLLDDIISNLKYMGSGNRTVDMKVNVPEGLTITSDKRRVSIILNNLVSNAIRYQNPDISDPFVQVTVALKDDVAQIRVKDNGIGISPEYREKIFDMFYRISPMSAGSGLGLYIVKEAVEKINGTIELNSVPGEGTEFIISVPTSLS